MDAIASLSRIYIVAAVVNVVQRLYHYISCHVPYTVVSMRRRTLTYSRCLLSISLLSRVYRSRPSFIAMLFMRLRSILTVSCLQRVELWFVAVLTVTNWQRS